MAWKGQEKGKEKYIKPNALLNTILRSSFLTALLGVHDHSQVDVFYFAYFDQM